MKIIQAILPKRNSTNLLKFLKILKTTKTQKYINLSLGSIFLVASLEIISSLKLKEKPRINKANKTRTLDMQK